MTKIYAKQISPEHQESPLFWDIWPENVICDGNRSFKRHTTDLYDRILDAYDEAAYYYQELGNHPRSSDYKNLTDLVNDFFPPSEYRGRNYSTQNLHKIRRALELYETRGYYQGEHIPAMLEGITGKAWSTATIRGCCQGDWQDIIYPAEYGPEWLKCFEAEYFNTGTEWSVHDDETPPDGPENIFGVSIYCHGWSDDEIKKEIAESFGGTAENVVLYTFTGWKRTAQYEEV